jgi:hypothetical protein
MVQESLSTCLAELDRIRPATLLQYERLGKSHRFRAELPYLDRTLEMFHRLSLAKSREGTELLSLGEKFGETASIRVEIRFSSALQMTRNPRTRGDFARGCGESATSQTVWRSEMDSNFRYRVHTAICAHHDLTLYGLDDLSIISRRS